MSDVEGDDVDDAGPDDDEIVFELTDWTDAERAVLGDKLKAGGISHEWEDGDLVVADADADQAEEAIEAVEYPDQLPADSDEAPPAENEGSYEVMSALFVAADRLQRDPEDPVAGAEFDTAADSVAESGPPYGVDAQFWQQVQELSVNVCDQLDDADPDVIARDAAALRQLLSRYV